MHHDVNTLMKGVGSMKRYRKEGSERRLTGDAGFKFANKADLPPAGCAPAPPPPWNSGRRDHRDGRRREGGRGKDRREGGEREGSLKEQGSENERQGLVYGKDGAGSEGASLTPRSHHH